MHARCHKGIAFQQELLRPETESLRGTSQVQLGQQTRGAAWQAQLPLQQAAKQSAIRHKQTGNMQEGNNVQACQVQPSKILRKVTKQNNVEFPKTQLSTPDITQW